MNTPAHAMVNLLVMGRQQRIAVQLAVLVGAVLPDVPIFLFYFVEKVLRGTPEQVIWSQVYFQEHWQNFIDLFNSVPLMLLGLALSLGAQSTEAIALFLSMMLHVVGDLPLHHDDAHRHFFPLSDWRFISPVSYWDPRHYGHWVTPIEIVAVIASCMVLFLSSESLVGRAIIGTIGGSYMAYFIYVLTVWV